MSVKNCDTPCLDPRPDSCNYWGGESIPELGIETGMCYPNAMAKFAEAFLQLKNNKINIEGQQVSNNEALQIIADKLEKIQLSNISLGEGTLGVSNFTSEDAISLSGKKMKYSLTPTQEGSSLDVNLSDLENSLPSGFGLTSTRTVLHGKPVNGSSVIVDTSRRNFNIDIPPNRYPVSGETVSKVRTPNGEVVLKKDIYLAAVQNENVEVPFDIEDRIRGVGGQDNLESLLNRMTSELNNMKNYVDSLKNVSVGDLKDKDIKSVLAASLGNQNEQSKKLENLEKLNIKVPKGQGVEEEKVVNAQEAFNESLSELANTKKELEAISAKYTDLESKVANVAKLAESLASNISSS